MNAHHDLAGLRAEKVLAGAGYAAVLDRDQEYI